MGDELVKILDGNTFVVSDVRGDIEASPSDPMGLFSFDTRFLSRWVLSVNGRRLTSLSTDDLQYFEARFFLVARTGTVYVDSKLSVIRQRAVGDGFCEQLTILNHADEPVDLNVRIDAGCDFADLFEVKDALEKKGKHIATVADGRLQLAYDRDKFRRATEIFASAPAQLDESGLTFAIQVAPHGEWTTDINVVTAITSSSVRHDRPKYSRAARRPQPNMKKDLDRWLTDAPRLECDWEPLSRVYQRSLIDLAALRFSPLTAGRRSLPAAGLQGYAYDAKLRGARLARLVWKDPEYASRLEKQAAALKRRFNRDFWVEDGQYFALALDTDGKPVDALASNNGHLLWSGIVDKSKARAVARHLVGPRLFSGWGVRTLAEGEGRFNPIGYHVGTVWPFDNSFIAWGHRRYGFRAEAARIAAGILEAAEFFDGRLPEAFGGYPRALTNYPVQYPTACSPQAWSTGAPLLLLRTMLGLEPIGENLIVDPALPLGIGHLELLDIPGRWGKIDAFGRGRVDVVKRSSRAHVGLGDAVTSV